MTAILVTVLWTIVLLGLMWIAGGRQCLFRNCKWQHEINGHLTWRENPNEQVECGLYQCVRCKTLSMGSPR